MSEGGIVLIGQHWLERQNELTYVARSVAGAASRWADVCVLAPLPLGHIEPDGAFDVLGMGVDEEYHWPDTLSPSRLVIVDDLTPKIRELLSGIDARRVFYLAEGE